MYQGWGFIEKANLPYISDVFFPIGQATVLAKSLVGGEAVNNSKISTKGGLSSQNEFIVAYSGVNTAKAVFTNIKISIPSPI
jgi:TctA family transporter